MASSSSSQDLETVKTEIRAIILSSKNSLTEQQLEKDYRKMADSKGIPYRILGYRSLQDFLESIPDVVRLNTRHSPYLISGVANADTKHIQDLVRGQKSKRGLSSWSGFGSRYSSSRTDTNRPVS